MFYLPLLAIRAAGPKIQATKKYAMVQPVTVVSYEELAKLFFEIHDPTQVDRQGPDIGYQYRSMVFYHNEKQKNITENLINILESKGYNVVTDVVTATKFWPAENYHQDYYQNNEKQPYCHFYKKKF